MNAGYGYKHDKHTRWDGMVVVSVHADVQSVAFLEAALIRVYHGFPGCRNQQLGGEGLREGCDFEGPYFCYVVHKKLIPPKRAL